MSLELDREQAVLTGVLQSFIGTKVSKIIKKALRSTGHAGLKWGAGVKGVEFVVENLETALEEHLAFICRRAYFAIMELVRDLIFLIVFLEEHLTDASQNRSADHETVSIHSSTLENNFYHRVIVRKTLRNDQGNRLVV